MYKEYGVYNKYDLTYDFSEGEAYLSTAGLSKIIDNNIYEFTIFKPTIGFAVILYSENMPINASMTLQCLDSNNDIIPGKAKLDIGLPVLKSTYTFKDPVSENKTVRFKILSSSFPNINRFITINLTIFMS